MRILVLTNHFPPDLNPTGLLMARLFSHLHDRGHEVSVITSMPHYEGFKTAPSYRRKLTVEEVFGGIHVRRVYVYASGDKSMLKRLFNYVTFSWFALVAGLLSRRKFDVIFCPNGAFFTGVAAWVVGAARRAPFVYNVQDLYPEVPIQAGLLTNQWVIGALRGVERFMYAKAARVSVITESFRDSVAGRGVEREKVAVIPNFVDTERIYPRPKDNPVSRRLDLHDKFVVSHAGNLGYVYDISTLLDAAEILRGEEIVILIVGGGVALDGLVAKAKRLELDNVRFLPFQSEDDFPWVRAAMDIQLSLYKSGASKHSMPSKVYEIMASGRPLLVSADRDSDVCRLVESSRCGLCVEPGNAYELSEGIHRLKSDPELRTKMGARGRETAMRDYSLTKIAETYEDFLEDVISTRMSARGHARSVNRQ